MVLKEAYHYMNCLNELINEAQSFLTKSDFITETEQIHKKSKANPNAKDESFTLQTAVDYQFKPLDICDFLKKAFKEKEKLFSAIVEAKKTTDIDIDSAISVNKSKQSYLYTLKLMLHEKPRVFMTTGTGYAFSNDGVQVPYNYDIDNYKQIKYNKSKVKETIKLLQKEVETTSTKLDVIQATTEVNYTPIWDISDTLDDILSN